MTENKEPKIALITGINGFIGRNLAGILSENGYRVAGLPRPLLNNPTQLELFIDEISPTHIFHLASYGNHSNQSKVSEIVTTNYLKTFFLLQACDKLGVPNFINFSSSSVYGLKDSPMKETDTLDTNTFYGATKVGAEYLCRAYSKQSQTNIVTVRPFSVYGEGEAMHRFIPSLIDAIENQKEYTLYEDALHDWIYIEDFLKGVLIATDNIHKLNGQAINIGTGKQHTNRQVYDIVCQVSGKKPLDTEFKKGGKTYDTNKSWVADNTKLVGLGYQGEYTLEQGISKTYKYYKDMMNLELPDPNDLDSLMNKTLEWAGVEWEDIK